MKTLSGFTGIQTSLQFHPISVLFTYCSYHYPVTMQITGGITTHTGPDRNNKEVKYSILNSQAHSQPPQA